MMNFVFVVHVSLCIIQAVILGVVASKEYAQSESECIIVFLIVSGPALVGSFIGGSPFLAFLIVLGSLVSGLELMWGFREKTQAMLVFFTGILLRIFEVVGVFSSVSFILNVLSWTLTAIGLTGDLSGDVVVGSVKGIFGEFYYLILGTTWVMAVFTAPLIVQGWVWIEMGSDLAFFLGGVLAIVLKKFVLEKTKRYTSLRWKRKGNDFQRRTTVLPHEIEQYRFCMYCGERMPIPPSAQLVEERSSPRSTR